MRRLCYRLSASLLLVLIAVGGIRAQTDTPAKPTAVHELQRASRDHDRAWLADHVGYLLRYHGSAVAVIRNRSDFLRNDETVVSDRLHNAVEMQGPERVFESGQGLMVGDGTHKMWLRESREGERALRDRDDHNEMR